MTKNTSKITLKVKIEIKAGRTSPAQAAWHRLWNKWISEIKSNKH